MIQNGPEELIVFGGFIGGYEDNVPSKSIFKMKCASGDCIWTKMDREMEIGRRHFEAIPILDSMTNCTNT